MYPVDVSEVVVKKVSDNDEIWVVYRNADDALELVAFDCRNGEELWSEVLG